MSRARKYASARASPRARASRDRTAPTFKTIAKNNARLVTTGAKKVPNVIEVYANAHSAVAVYDNGGTLTQNRRDGLLTARTPQARSRGVRSATYRSINEKGQAYVGYTTRVSQHTSGREVARGPRMREHEAGRGSQVTREDAKHHCDLTVLHATTRQGLKGERKLYAETKKTHGDSTRGAWNCARRSL